jgi:hypothetical protein
VSEAIEKVIAELTQEYFIIEHDGFLTNTRIIDDERYLALSLEERGQLVNHLFELVLTLEQS